MTRRLVAAGTAFVVLTASASGLSAGTDRSHPLRLKEGCVSKRERARVARFRAPDGARLVGVSLGSGPIGIALGHESDGSLCNWMPFARTLARDGYRVLAFDFRGWGSSPGVGGSRRARLDLDFAGAAGRLRKLGAAQVVLAGASIGADAALAGAVEVTPHVSAVLSLSAADSTFSTRLDGSANVPKLEVPVLFMAAEGDTGFADAARVLYSKTVFADKKLLIVPGGAHGTAMLRGVAGAGPRQAILDFIRDHTATRALAGAGRHPTAPRIAGPRRTSDRTPTFRFISREAGVRAGAIRFRCAVDRTRLHACPSRYTVTLQVGRHTLRARALDPGGRGSATVSAHVSVIPPIPHADQTIRVGNDPYNMAAGFGSVWVAVASGLVRLDAVTGAVVARIPIEGRPWGVAVGEGAVWVGSYTRGLVSKVDPSTNAVTRQVTLTSGLGEASPVGVAAGDGSVWAADNSSDQVWRLDPATGAVLATVHVGDAHEFVGVGEGAVWVSSENGTVGEIDPATGALTRSVAVGADADFLGFSPGAVWVTNYRTEFLWRIDPATGAVTAKLKVGGGGAQGVGYDGSSLWVALYDSAQVLRVDPVTGRVQARFRVGERPRGLVVAAGNVWVANSHSGTVSRIRVP